MDIHSTEISNASELPTHPYTNDVGIGDAYDELAILNVQLPPTEVESAVIVGAGGLLTMADVLPDTIFITDRQPALLQWVVKCTGVILDCATKDAFIKKLNVSYQGTEGDSDVFGARHFLSSQERYLTAREAMVRKSRPFCIDRLWKTGRSPAISRYYSRKGADYSCF
jgi:hypothetical protein